MSGRTPAFGAVRAGGWLDVEVPPDSPACGKPFRYTERISTSKGSLTVRAGGPRLCTGFVYTVHRSYTVIAATGGFRQVRGRGTITLAVLSVGAAETWTRPKP